eukprot:scaffold111473_cov15-Tisochrysis_lutea.AAC.2
MPWQLAAQAAAAAVAAFPFQRCRGRHSLSPCHPHTASKLLFSASSLLYHSNSTYIPEDSVPVLHLQKP